MFDDADPLFARQIQAQAGNITRSPTRWSDSIAESRASMIGRSAAVASASGRATAPIRDRKDTASAIG